MFTISSAWLLDRDVIISPKWGEHSAWSEQTVALDMTQKQIDESPRSDPAQPINREYKITLYDYYGCPKYWDR